MKVSRRPLEIHTEEEVAIEAALFREIPAGVAAAARVRLFGTAITGVTVVTHVVIDVGIGSAIDMIRVRAHAHGRPCAMVVVGLMTKVEARVLPLAVERGMIPARLSTVDMEDVTISIEAVAGIATVIDVAVVRRVVHSTMTKLPNLYSSPPSILLRKDILPLSMYQSSTIECASWTVVGTSEILISNDSPIYAMRCTEEAFLKLTEFEKPSVLQDSWIDL